MEDWTSLGQHKRHPEFPVVTRESRRNSRKTTWFPRHRKMKPFPATASQEKPHVRNWRWKRYLAPLRRPHKVPRHPGLPGEDRKSTRLNSSHQLISYAVFCLKKKKTEATPKHTTQKKTGTPTKADKAQHPNPSH